MTALTSAYRAGELVRVGAGGQTVVLVTQAYATIAPESFAAVAPEGPGFWGAVVGAGHGDLYSDQEAVGVLAREELIRTPVAGARVYRPGELVFLGDGWLDGRAIVLVTERLPERVPGRPSSVRAFRGLVVGTGESVTVYDTAVMALAKVPTRATGLEVLAAEQGVCLHLMTWRPADGGRVECRDGCGATFADVVEADEAFRAARERVAG